MHAVRLVAQEYGENAQYGVLSVDLTNAFNLLSRNAFLHGLLEHFPSLLAWISYCDNSDSPYLWTGERFLQSVTEVQQGGPLGPLLFAVALHPLALELQNQGQTGSDTDETCSTILSSWYLDDGYIIAHHERLQSALEFLRSDKMRSHGFHLNLSKCELWWWPAEPQQDVKASYPVDLNQVYIEGTLLILNAPVGSTQFCEWKFMEKVGSLKPVLDDVAALENTHVSFTLLKFCHGVCNLSYQLRVTPPEFTITGAKLFDGLIEKCLRRILGGT